MSGQNNLDLADSISSPEKSLFNPLQSCLCPYHHIDNEILNITGGQLMIKPSDLSLRLIKITAITTDSIMLRMWVLKKTQERHFCVL